MKKPLLIILLGFTGLVLLAVVGLGIFLATFDPNAYKEQLSAAVEKATGRTLQFQSDLEMSFFPRLALKTGRVVITDPDIFGGEPFLSVESASLRVSLDSLLERVIEVEEVTLNAARLNLVTNAVGQHNWAYNARRKTDDTEPPESGAGGTDKTPLQAPESRETRASSGQEGLGSFALTIQQFTCVDAKVSYRDLQKGTSYSGTLDTFTLLNIHADTEIPLDLSGTVNNDKGGQKVRFSLQGELRVSSADNQIFAEMKNFEVQGNGFGTGPFLLKGKASLRYDQREGTVTVSGLQGSAGLLPEEGVEGSKGMSTEYTDGHLTFVPAKGMQAARVEGGIALTELDVDTLQRRIAPTASVDAGDAAQGAPNMTNPTVGKSQINPQLARDMQELSAAKAKLDEQKKISEKTAKTEMSWIDGSFTVAIKKAFVKSVPVQDLHLEVRSEQGAATVSYNLNLFKGAVTGTAKISAVKETLSLSLSGQVKGLDMAEATNTLSGKYTITGLLGASWDLAGKGAGSEEILQSLSGKSKVQVGSGEVRGFSLIPGNLPGLKAVPVNFPFESLSASANVEQGVAQSKDITLQSKVLAGRGGGKVHLAYGQMDLGLDFLLGGMPPTIPVSINGPFGALSYSVDMRTFLRNVAESAGSLSPDAGKGLLRNVGDMILR